MLNNSYQRNIYQNNLNLPKTHTPMHQNENRFMNNVTPLPQNYFMNNVTQIQNARENFKTDNEVDDEFSKDDIEPQLNIKYKEKDIYVITSPQVFGPPLWFSLHNGSAHYPTNPSPIARMQMKNIILGLPVLIPCKNCQNHATSYIEKNYDQLDDICSSRDKVFKFFVDFHNHVNERYNKPKMSYDDAYKLYMGTVKFSPFQYS
jgi:hypothetical protein